MNELFDPKQVASKSPRLRWMEKHNVFTHFLEADQNPFCAPIWECWVGNYDDALQYSFELSDKSDDQFLIDNKMMVEATVKGNALIRLARNNNWKTWLEEGWENEEPR